MNEKLSCASKIEYVYYAKGHTLICAVCGADISQIDDIITAHDAAKTKFQMVLPTCKDDICGDFICTRKRKVKRLPPPAQRQPQPKKQKPGDGAVALEEG